jgi:hypothetical protein
MMVGVAALVAGVEIMVGVVAPEGIAEVICCVAATVAPLLALVRIGGGGAGGTRGGGGGELDGRCDSVICYFSVNPRAVKASDGL